jgi:hypothetical protein
MATAGRSRYASVRVSCDDEIAVRLYSHQSLVSVECTHNVTQKRCARGITAVPECEKGGSVGLEPAASNHGRLRVQCADASCALWSTELDLLCWRMVRCLTHRAQGASDGRRVSPSPGGEQARATDSPSISARAAQQLVGRSWSR